MASSSAHELSDRSLGTEPSVERRDADTQHMQDVQQLQQEFSLPPADGGLQAWLFLAGSFAIEALVWGFPYSFGLFQDYYTRNEPFKHDPSGIPVIGTTALGIMYLGSPVCFAAMGRWPLVRRWSNPVGLVIMVVAMISSSYSTAVWHLIFTQGALYAIGGSLVYSPVIIFVDEWFIQRKGFAFGVMWAGTGFAGVAVPFVMSWLLERYSFTATLRIWGIILAVCSIPLLLVVKPRIPPSQNHQPRRMDLSFLKDRSFIILQLGNILEGLGFFMPTVYLPSYARSLGIPSGTITATVSLLNGSMVFGCIFVGLLVDRFHVTTAVLICTIGATISTFVFWGLAVSIPLLCIFSIVYGFFAGGFTTTYTGIVRETHKANPSSDTGLVFGMLAAGRGVGSVICGPLSEALMRKQGWADNAAFGYGTEYGPLIVFTGISAVLGGIGFGAKRLGWLY
ncbi:hypothetical protein FQN50_008352 [Emmonsiellopsis sp. PD_5]|nr:hypothetical protein FQN50_008352 [Emmonsiellopsis sp. PD_5]